MWPWKQVSVRSRSLEMAPFDRSHTSSYSLSIVTMAPSFARYSDSLVENHEIFIPTCIWRSRRGWPRRNFVKMFDADKTRMIGYRMVKKLLEYVKPFSCNTGTLRTDGQTDGRTNSYISIARQHTDARYWYRNRQIYIPYLYSTPPLWGWPSVLSRYIGGGFPPKTSNFPPPRTWG